MSSFRSKATFEKMATTGVSLTLPPQIKADMKRIKKKLGSAGILDDHGRHSTKKEILPAQDGDIIKYFASLAHGLLSYYRCADNLGEVKDLIMHRVRSSLEATLSSKHKMSRGEFLEKYGDPISIHNPKGGRISFLSNMQVYNVKKEFLLSAKPNPFLDLHKVTIRVTKSIINQGECAVANCTNTDIEVHHIRQLYKRNEEGKGFTVISAGRAKRISGILANESALKRKQIPLCKQHHRA